MKAHSTIKKITSLVVLLWSGLTSLGFSQIVSTQTGMVEFISSVPLHTFSGVSNNLVGQIDFKANTVDFYVDLATLKTGIGKRDKDMRTTLEVNTFPFAEFFGAFESEVDQHSTNIQAVRVVGQFGLHGHSKKIAVDGSLKREGDLWQLEAAWTVSLTDFNIVPPKLLMMKVDNVQKINIKAQLRPSGN